MTFAIAVPSRPPSLRRGSNPRFQEMLREKGRQILGEDALLQGNLYARILWFHRGPTSQDVDNITKNILDALKGIVYSDDVVITRCMTQKIRMDTDDYTFDLSNATAQTMDDLLPMIVDDDTEHVTYIEIGPMSDSTIHFGQVR